MSLVLKIVVPILIIGALVWLYMTKYPSTMPQSSAQTQAVQQTSDGQQTPQTSAGASSDAQLQADLNSLDTDMNAASNDSAAVDESLNDKPVQQTE